MRQVVGPVQIIHLDHILHKIDFGDGRVAQLEPCGGSGGDSEKIADYYSVEVAVSNDCYAIVLVRMTLLELGQEGTGPFLPLIPSFRRAIPPAVLIAAVRENQVWKPAFKKRSGLAG